MADKVQINPLITAETREALRDACKERGMAQGDLVELALQAYLEPFTVTEALQRFSEKQDEMMGMIGKLEDTVLLVVDALRELGEPAPAHPETPMAPPPIATYAQMYGPLVPEATPVPAPTPAPVHRAGRLRRWLMREEAR
jgi:hypothetical protein